MKKHLTPMRMLLYGIVLYFIVYLIGPYKWEIKDWNAMIALFIGELLMLLGMLSCKSFSRKYTLVLGNLRRDKGADKDVFQLSKSGEMVLVAVDVVTIICFLLYIRNISAYVSFSGLGEITDTRYMLADNLSLTQKVINYGVLASIPVYIISGYEEEIQLKILQYLRTICFWLPAISFLLTSARWNFVLSLFIFFFVNYDNEKSTLRAYAKSKKKGKIISIVLIGVLLSVTLILFQTRGYDKSIPTSLLRYGTVEIKEFYKNIPILGKGFYQLMMYVTHSVPYYSSVYSSIDFSHSQYGTYAFAHLRLFSPIFNNWKDFIVYNPGLTGNYTPTITGFFIDWGFIGAFVAMYFTGYLFEWININARKKPLIKYLKPIVLFQCFMSLEGYVYTIAATNIIVFIVIAVSIAVLIVDYIIKA